MDVGRSRRRACRSGFLETCCIFGRSSRKSASKLRGKPTGSLALWCSLITTRMTWWIPAAAASPLMVQVPDGYRLWRRRWPVQSQHDSLFNQKVPETLCFRLSVRACVRLCVVYISCISGDILTKLVTLQIHSALDRKTFLLYMYSTFCPKW